MLYIKAKKYHMKYIISIAFFLFIIGCNSKNENSNLTNNHPFDSLHIERKTLYFDSISSTDFEELKYNRSIGLDTIPVDTNRIKIKHDTIFIITDSGKEVVFANDTTYGETMVEYQYVKTLGELGMVELVATYWEWTRVFLVSFKTGNQAELWGNPHFSPNKKYMICYSDGLESGEMPNGFQLFNVENNEVELIFELEIENWMPDEIKWESDSTIFIKRAKLDQNYNRKFDFVKTTIIK